MSTVLDICEAIDGPSPEWYREAASEYAPPRDPESPEMNYEYRGNGRSLTETEAQHRLTQRPQLAARAAVEAALPGASKPAIKGAVKVNAFPEKSKYPFRQIADDGGIWQLDPAAYKTSANAIQVAACHWARKHGMTCKAMTDDGMTYVQFTRAAS